MKKGLVFLLVLMISVVSCQRSQRVQRDQEYYQPEGAQSYYNTDKPASTRRLEVVAQPKKRVVVFNFWNDTPVKQTDLGLFVGDELRRALGQTEKVLLPPDMKLQLETADFVQRDKVKVAQLVREGRKLGVAAVVMGKVGKIVFRQQGDDIGLLRKAESVAAVDVELKVFDINSGREVGTFQRAGQASANAMLAWESVDVQSPTYRTGLIKHAARDAIHSVAPEVVKSIEKMSWEGRIAKVAANKMYLTAGHASGLVVGDILKVLSQGEDVYDTSSGALLGRSGGQLKGTLELMDFIGADGAVAKIHTGGNFQEGDTVQLY